MFATAFLLCIEKEAIMRIHLQPFFAALVCLAVFSGSACAEEYIALFGGKARTAGTTATATSSNPFCFFPPCPGPVTSSNNVNFDRGNTSGIRYGFWGEHWGVAAEYSTTFAPHAFSPNNTSAEASYDAFSLIPMVRTSYFRSESMPEGRVDLYGGIGFSQISGRLWVSSPKVTVSGDTSGATGILFLLGADVKYSKFSFFVELRKMETDLSVSFLGNSASAQISTMATVGGVAVRW